MIGKRMTAPQRAAYARLRTGEAIPVTVETGRVLHALRRQGRARIMLDRGGIRVARLRLNAAQSRVIRREDQHQRALWAAYDALPATRATAAPVKGRARKMKLDGSHYDALVSGGWIPPAEM